MIISSLWNVVRIEEFPLGWPRMGLANKAYFFRQLALLVCFRHLVSPFLIRWTADDIYVRYKELKREMILVTEIDSDLMKSRVTLHVPCFHFLLDGVLH